uniref:Neuroendocrine convertase 2 n=2 Tax=Globodera pallida TaxID=36090 RepID=A0A183BJV8_GLOPA
MAANPSLTAVVLLVAVLLPDALLALEVFTNHFLVHTNTAGAANAHRVAKRNGFINRGPVLGLDTQWHFVQPALSHARTRRSVGHHAKLSQDKDIAYVEQMTGYKRLKRGYRPLADRLQKQLDFTSVQSPSDPLYPFQWYLKNDGQSNGKPRLDLNVEKAGDGGEDDDCNCDGYAASMWTISINSAINNGENAHYDESCSSTLASTFSNGGRNPESGVATTDLYGRCTRSHSGTSAAAPEAAGVFALALEANPQVTWRDLQHLTVLTSSRNSLFDGRCRELPPLELEANCSHFEWQMNDVGLEYNHLFGFGVLDAAEMVWKTAPPRFHCEAGTIDTPREIPASGEMVLTLRTDACAGSTTEVNFLEHVQAIVSLNSSRRGDTTLYLISPSGTPSMILSRRPKDDDAKDGFTNWPFMTTHTWGEDPRGRWPILNRVKCPDSRPDCGQTCQGQWCHVHVSTSASGCGFGPPSLPYVYQSSELFRQRSRVCVSLSRGNGSPHEFCVCNFNLCNDPGAISSSAVNSPNNRPNPFAAFLRTLSGGEELQNYQRHRSVGRPSNGEGPGALFECISCDMSSEDAAMTSNCRQNRCWGHFCVYATQRVFVGGSFQSLGWSGASAALQGNGGSGARNRR